MCALAGGIVIPVLIWIFLAGSLCKSVAANERAIDQARAERLAIDVSQRELRERVAGELSAIRATLVGMERTVSRVLDKLDSSPQPVRK